MKRVLMAAAGAAAVVAVTLGSASALGITDPGVIQAGSSSTLSCDTNGVQVVGYNLEDDWPGGFLSRGVTVEGISSACEGHTLVARVNDASGNELARGQVELTSANTGTGNSAKITWTEGTTFSDGGRHTLIGARPHDIHSVSFLIG